MPKPTPSRSSSNPARRRYRSAVGEPGAREVFTQAGGVRPKARALRATRPAATRSLGSDVLVQLVIAAMAKEPLPGCWADAGAGRAASNGAIASTVWLAGMR